MPWILLEHIIKNQRCELPLVERLGFVLDVYNDAAHRALNVLQQQFLYNEIEAEVNLAFDQLIYLISDEIYSYYKNIAASQRLEGLDLTSERVAATAFTPFTERRQYHVMISQRHLRLLGRSVDLRSLVSQQINDKLHKDVDYAIKRFEAGGLSGLTDLESMLEVVRRTHHLVGEELDLDDFDTILDEVDESLAPDSFAGRMLIHTLSALITDLVPNYAYNEATRRCAGIEFAPPTNV